MGNLVIVDVDELKRLIDSSVQGAFEKITPIDPKRSLYDLEKAAVYLGISKQTLRKKANDNVIRCHRPAGELKHYFYQIDLDNYVQGL